MALITQTVLYLIPAALIFWLHKTTLLNSSARLTIDLYLKETRDEINYSQVDLAKFLYKNYLIQLGLALTAYFVIVINHILYLAPAWYAFLISGCLIAYYVFRDQKRYTQIQYIREFVQKGKFEESERAARKSGIVVLVVAVAISGNWAFQATKNFSVEKDSGIRNALDLNGSGWCAEFADIDVYEGGETVVKSGGWPCIIVGGITEIKFSSKDRDPLMCFQVTLNKESGLPGEDIFYNNFRAIEVCKPSNWYEGWSTEGLQREIYDTANISSELSSLQNEMCRRYKYRLTFDDQLTYC